MSKYYYVVTSRAVLGREQEYNEWYERQHIPDVLSVPGFLSAERLVTEVDGERQYLAIYEMDIESPETAISELSARLGADRMPISDALDMSKINATLYRPLPKNAA
jgi:hypothetical protein